MTQEMMDALAGRMTTIDVPQYKLEGSDLPSYWVTVKNKRTGYTKLMTRSKAHRYINNRPSSWTIVNPLVSFKDTYELTR